MANWVASAVDRRYLFPWTVMVISVAKNYRSSQPLRFYLLGQDLSHADKDFLLVIGERYSLDFVLEEDNEHYSRWLPTRRRNNLASSSRMSTAAYLKIFLPERVLQHADRFLVMDADMVALNSIAELFDANTSHVIAAVRNIPRNHGHQFNSGLMLIDGNLWRKGDYQSKSELLLRNFADTLHSHDQQVLNLAVGGFDPLPLKWNYMEDHYRFRQKSSYSEQEILEARANPAVVHYAVGTDKPWKKWSEHPRANEYRKLARQIKGLAVSHRLSIPR